MMMVSGTMPLLVFLGPLHPISLKAGSIPFPTCHSLPSPAKRALCLSAPKVPVIAVICLFWPREMQRLKNLQLLTTYHVGEAGELGKLESSSKRGLLMPGEYWRKLAENRGFQCNTRTSNSRAELNLEGECADIRMHKPCSNIPLE